MLFQIALQMTFMAKVVGISHEIPVAFKTQTVAEAFRVEEILTTNVDMEVMFQ